jgi:hypothetical protein
MTTAINELLSEMAAGSEALSALAEQPEVFGAKLGFGQAQLSALRSADRFERPMRPVTFTTGMTITV